MRRTLSILAVASLLAFPAAAQHIVGTDIVGGFVQLVDVNPATGTCSLIGGPTSASTLFGSGTAYDASANVYYFLGSTGGAALLYKVQTGTGTSSSVPISGVTQPNVLDLEFNSSNSTLYALINVAGAKQLATVDTTTGVITPVGSPFSSGAAISYSGQSKLDSSAGHWFFRGSPTDYGVDMTTNDVYRSGPEPTTPLVGMSAGGGSWFFLQLNGSDGRLLQMRTTNTGTFGNVTTTGAGLTGGTLSVTGGTDTYDATGSRYYFAGTLNGGPLSLFAVDTTSPTLAMAAGYPKVLTGTGTNFSNPEFDAGTLPVRLQRYTAE